MASIKLAGVVNDSVVDGEGYRFSIFTQGCPHDCPGCHNPQTHDFAGGYLEDTDRLLAQILENGLLQGVTFSGGDPFCQPEPLTQLAKAVHEHGLDVWCYTGYTLEALLQEQDQARMELLKNIDVLVDGPFILAQRDLTLAFRGSRNQRIINVPESMRQKRTVVLDLDTSY